MRSRFTPWPKVSGKYGAPMGRNGIVLRLDREFDTLESVAASGPAGEYDAGGAYWGISNSDGSVWAVWRKGKGNEGVQYVRAWSRGAAVERAFE